jgi:hypothetical protein
MSDHHQTAGKPVKSERRVEHHRERQAARAALNVPDLEDVLDPPRVHNTAAIASPGRVEESRRRFRTWKQPFWKRRSNRRRTRNDTIAGSTTSNNSNRWRPADLARFAVARRLGRWRAPGGAGPGQQRGAP